MSAALDNGLEVNWAALAGSNEKAGIDIVAIHSHLTGETPRVLFLHDWGIGPAEELAAPFARRCCRRSSRPGPEPGPGLVRRTLSLRGGCG